MNISKLNAKQKGAFCFPLAVHPDFFLYTVTLASGNRKRGELYCARREC